jgi:hypothetical protein
MKPCRKNRKQIVWLAMDALDAAKAAELRAHFQRCEGCRLYFAEIAHLKQTLAVTGCAPEIEASESLHRRIMSAFRANQTRTAREPKFPGLWGLHTTWRTAVPAVCAVGIALVILAAAVWRHNNYPLAPTQTYLIRTPKVNTDILPTIANYRAVANQSLDELDELIAQQAKKPVPAPPRFTATTLALSNLPD